MIKKALFSIITCSPKGGPSLLDILKFISEKKYDMLIILFVIISTAFFVPSLWKHLFEIFFTQQYTLILNTAYQILLFISNKYIQFCLILFSIELLSIILTDFGDRFYQCKFVIFPFLMELCFTLNKISLNIIKSTFTIGFLCIYISILLTIILDIIEIGKVTSILSFSLHNYLDIAIFYFGLIIFMSWVNIER